MFYSAYSNRWIAYAYVIDKRITIKPFTASIATVTYLINTTDIFKQVYLSSDRKDKTYAGRTEPY